MKKLIFAAIVAASAFAAVQESGVVIETAQVTKTVSREPREVVFRISRATGEIEADITYETVVRVDGSAASWEPFRVVTLKWAELTNAVPALAQSLEQFRAAARASLTNSP